jgi:hypothetical protein
MRVRFLDVAQQELDDAVGWYNGREKDLGLLFLDEIDRTVRRILTFPLASTEIDDGIRRFGSSISLRHHLRNRRRADHRNRHCPSPSPATLLG